MNFKIETTAKNLEIKISSVKQLIGKLKPVKDQEENSHNEKHNEINKLKAEMVKIEQSIEKIVFSGVYESLTGSQEAHKKDTQNINNTIKDINGKLDAQQTTCNDIVKKIEICRNLNNIKQPMQNNIPQDQDTTTELIMCMDSNNDRPEHNYGTYYGYGLE